MGSKLDTQSPLCQRVREVIIEKERSVTRFAEVIGIAQTTLNQQLVVGKIASSTLEQILQTYPDISAEWLMRGTGGMYIGTPSQDTLDDKQTIAQLTAEKERLQSQIDLLNKVINKLV